MRLGDKLKRNFARNLQWLRTRNNMTQSNLAEKLNERYREYEIDLRRTSIVSYEGEVAMPKMDALYCIADYFGKTVDDLIHADLQSAEAAQPRFLPVSGRATEAESGPASKDGCPGPRIPDGDLDALLTACVDGIAYRQFYKEFLKRFLQQLKDKTANEEEHEQLDVLFYKTMLGCQISRSKYLQDLAETKLDEREFKVFMAFGERNADVALVAKGLELSEPEVVAIFNSAQTKLSSI